MLIASTASSHFNLIKKIIKNNKIIFCEKPLSCNLRSTKKIYELVKSSKIFFGMALNRRFAKEYLKLKNKIDSGNIGKIETLSFVHRTFNKIGGNAKNDGGLFRDKGIHFFDLANWFVNSKPIEVTAFGSCLIDNSFIRDKDYDTAMILIKYENDVLAQFTFGRRTSYGHEERVEIFGSKGIIHLDTFTNKKKKYDNFNIRFLSSYKKELDVFINHILRKGRNFLFYEGYLSQLISELAIKSIIKRKKILIPKI